MPDPSRQESPRTHEDDTGLDRLVLGILLAFLLVVLLTPAEWLLKLSMWWNGIH